MLRIVTIRLKRALEEYISNDILYSGVVSSAESPILNQRWYDGNATVSMAISLLQNVSAGHREKLIATIEQILQERYPWAYNEYKQERFKEVWGVFFQKRKSMDRHAWFVVELWRYLSEDDRHKIALETINLVYCAEHEDNAALYCESHSDDLRTAI